MSKNVQMFIVVRGYDIIMIKIEFYKTSPKYMQNNEMMVLSEVKIVHVSLTHDQFLVCKTWIL